MGKGIHEQMLFTVQNTTSDGAVTNRSERAGGSRKIIRKALQYSRQEVSVAWKRVVE